MTLKTGAVFLAEQLEAYGVTHVFMVPAILRRTLVEMEMRTKIKRLHVHSEKSAVYMADGFARAAGKPAICMAQVIGALKSTTLKRPSEYLALLAKAPASERFVISPVKARVPAVRTKRWSPSVWNFFLNSLSKPSQKSPSFKFGIFLVPALLFPPSGIESLPHPVNTRADPSKKTICK